MKKDFIILLIFLNCAINAIIIESAKLSIVLDYITKPDTLFIFDLDNTLIRPEEELGTDEWFCHLVDKKMAEGNDYLTAIHYTVPVAYYVQFNIDMSFTENIIPELFNILISNNIAVMALTSRSLFTAEATIEQLELLDIYFFMPFISPEDLVLAMPLPCFYKNGILFAGNNDKAEALIHLFHLMNYFPKNVIFVDDKMKYHILMEKKLAEYGINYFGIRYSGCDDLVKNFDPAKAEEQYKKLKTKKSLRKTSHVT